MSDDYDDEFPEVEDYSDEGGGQWIGVSQKNPMGALMGVLEKEASGQISTIPLPWRRVTRAIGKGFYPGETTVLAADPGAGKSYIALDICRYAHEKRIDWAYLPLEDPAHKWVRRIAALHLNDWGIMDRGREGAAHAINRMKDEAKTIGEMGFRIYQNPKQQVGSDGRVWSPPIPWRDFIKWTYREAQTRDLIVVDPVSMISFGSGSKQFAAQEQFVEDMVNMVSATNCHLLMVAHLSKRRGRDAGLRPTLNDIQGSAAFTRFSHNGIILWSHGESESDVVTQMGETEKVKHRRSIILEKTRDGKGAGDMIAVDFQTRGPRLEEHGFVVRR